ncbi:MAG: hypothetical protein P8M15_02345 [Alphaproteobacteria bacterium]|nr:hypothetical protein [Alphaproteobacteria bacterium]
MRIYIVMVSMAVLFSFISKPSLANFSQKIISCKLVNNNIERLNCYDRLAKTESKKLQNISLNQQNAIKKEFRFDSDLLIKPLTFRLNLSGNLKISRSTMASREVENLILRISKALNGSSNWKLKITVHGAKTSLSRGNPYTGKELFVQAKSGLMLTKLSPERYSLEQGPEALPILWDDGRIRSINEHIIVKIFN